MRVDRTEELKRKDEEGGGERRKEGEEGSGL
jgi:hypothetical protein